MKKIFLLIALLLSISSVCYSQSLWYWQNPKPTGNNVKSVESVGPSTFFAGGDAGMLLKSTNSGSNWYPTISGVEHMSSINDIEFLNVNTGILVGGSSNNGGSGFVRYTSDGGNTWVNKVSTSQAMYRISRLNSNVLFATGEGQVYRTTNAGMSWSSILSYGNLRSVSFTNNNTGIAVGYNLISQGGFPPSYYTRSLILRTYNGGATWIPDSLGNGFQFNDIGFVNEQKGYLIGSSGHAFVTTNSGLSWNLLYSSGTDFRRILILDSNRIFLTQQNNLLITANGGVNWLSQYIDGANYDVSFNNSGNGILVSEGGIISKLSDYGQIWNYLRTGFIANFDFHRINAIYFVDNNYGTAVGLRNGYSTIFQTSNGGLIWSEQNPNNRTGDFREVFCISSQIQFVVWGSAILKTTNGGANWAQFSILNSGNDLEGIHFINENTGFVVGDWGKIAKSTNAGQTWAIQSYATANNFTDVHFINDSTGAVVGAAQSGVIFWTTDCGTTWLIRNSGLSTYTSFNGIRLLNKTTAVIADRDGRILRTTNSGINWTIVFSSSSYYIFNEICFRDSLNGIVVGDNGVILKTSNSGISWYVQQSDVVNNLKGCSAKGPNDFAVVGSYLSILSTTDINTIGIQNISSEIPSGFVLHQNYPNPFNPQTKIKFDIPANVKGQMSNVKLIIYDLLGREVATLVNEELKPGTYEADWDASNFSSGVYFYKIVAREFVQTKKMVLMK